MNHPSHADLALLASGDLGFARKALVNHHVRNCADCGAEVEEYATLRAGAAEAMPPGIDWDSLASEMYANIRLGLEAGECVRVAAELPRPVWNPRLTVALASLAALISCGIFFARQQHRTELHSPETAVLSSTADGVEVRAGSNSLELLNRKASIADQTVGAEGQLGVRYVDETGVTINNVYLQ